MTADGSTPEMSAAFARAAVVIEKTHAREYCMSVVAETTQKTTGLQLANEEDQLYLPDTGLPGWQAE